MTNPTLNKTISDVAQVVVQLEEIRKSHTGVFIVYAQALALMQDDLMARIVTAIFCSNFQIVDTLRQALHEAAKPETLAPTVFGADDGFSFAYAKPVLVHDEKGVTFQVTLRHALDGEKRLDIEGEEHSVSLLLAGTPSSPGPRPETCVRDWLVMDREAWNEKYSDWIDMADED